MTAGRLLLLLAPACAYYLPLDGRRERAILDVARQRVCAAQHDQALRLYKSAAHHSQSSRAYLLLALHQQRMGAPGKEGARQTFRRGVTLRSGTTAEAELFQAWALLESKDGNMHRAVLLLRRASQIDRQRVQRLLHWELFREYIRRHNPLARPRRRKPSPRGGDPLLP
jgi:hypothetical protein